MDKTPEETDDGSEKSFRLSDAQWADIKELYETGQSGVVEIADKYGVTRQNLSRRFKAEGLVKNSRAPASPIEELPPLPTRFVDKRPEWIEETKIEGYKIISQAFLLARKIVSDAVKAKKDLGTIDDDLRALGRYHKILVDNVAARLSLLEAAEYVDEEDLPELHIEDLTQDEILQHHKNTGAIDENATIEDMLNEAIELGEVFGLGAEDDPK
jgi:hypothetical protein